MVWFKRLQLNNFRNYGEASIDIEAPGFVVLHGANGAGKTNILEAISLFSPGRGLRGSRVQEIQNHKKSSEWAVSGYVETDYGTIRLGTGFDQ